MEAEREVIESREQMQVRRSEYIEANRRLKIVTRLEEKARDRHRLSILRGSQEELDELAGFRAFRQPILS
jgi:flagellar FliJ protein